MGDAISTHFEARANEVAGNNNYVNLNHGGGYKPTKAAMALAKLCYELILENGVQAKQDVLAGNCTEAVENVIEANTLLSGLGFENTGCAGAHAFNDAFVNILDGAKLLHGEKVAFGVLVQLAVENCDLLELEKLYRFYYNVGLPMTLEDMGIIITDGVAEAIARASMGTLWESEPIKVNWTMVKNAILKADLQGKVFRGIFSKGMETLGG
jgi:glycerol dehydrogenase